MWQGPRSSALHLSAFPSIGVPNSQSGTQSPFPRPIAQDVLCSGFLGWAAFRQLNDSKLRWGGRGDPAFITGITRGKGAPTGLPGGRRLVKLSCRCRHRGARSGAMAAHRAQVGPTLLRPGCGCACKPPLPRGSFLRTAPRPFQPSPSMAPTRRKVFVTRARKAG